MGSSKNDGHRWSKFSSPRQDVDHLDLVMECLEGGELLQRVNAGRFAEKDAADAAYQMLGDIEKKRAQWVRRRFFFWRGLK